MKINKLILGLGVAAVVLASCESQEATYPDFDYQTVYFANRYPVRTVELGEEPSVDNTLDNEHKVTIMATTGGVYENQNNVLIDYVVDPTLCNNLYFAPANTVAVVPMPSNYYELASSQISIASGNIMGGVQVHLTDAFFADPNSVKNTYVIPLLMTAVQGADSILQGKALINNASPLVDSHWSIIPRNFVLYAVKFVNPWHGKYLRRGTDVITGGTVPTKIRHTEYVEKNEVVSISTNSLTTATLPLTIVDNAGKTVNFNLVLTFADDQTCTVSGSSTTTPTYTVSGTGKFVPKGDKNSIGGKDCNALYLDYKVDFTSLSLTYNTKDTLVVRDRNVAPEYFTVVKK